MKWPARLAPLLAGNLLIWGLALLVLQRIPVSYKSEGAISVSGVGSQGKFFLPDAGQASAGEGNESPYTYLTTVDPRENYRQIALSDFVLQQAAASVNLSQEEFGEPDFQATEGTSIIDFEIEGSTPSEAQDKARAFYQALISRVKYLRQEEIREQQQDTSVSLENAKSSLQRAKQKLYTFTARSPLKVVNQINQLSEQLESLRIQQAGVAAQNQAAAARAQQISGSLGLSAQEVSNALALLDDQIFQQFMQQYSASTSGLQLLSATLTTNNPQLIDLRAEQERAEVSLLQRSQDLLGKPISKQLLQKLSLGDAGGRQSVASELLSRQAEQGALKAQAQALEQEIRKLSIRLNTLSQEQFTFDRLQQDAKLSESIFLSKLAQLNIDKPAYATSYPPLQLVVNPTLPEEPDGATQRTFVLGVLALSLIGTTGIITLWWNRETDIGDDDIRDRNSLVEDDFYNNLFAADAVHNSGSLEMDRPFQEEFSELLSYSASQEADRGDDTVADIKAIKALSLERLQSKTSRLYQHWSYFKRCVEEQEEELQLQCQAIKQLERDLSASVQRHGKLPGHEQRSERLRAQLNEEIERQYFLEESLRGQKSHLKKHYEALLQHQQILNNRLKDQGQSEFPRIAL